MVPCDWPYFKTFLCEVTAMFLLLFTVVMYGNRGNTVLTKPSKVSVHFSDGSSGSSESCGHGESWESSHSSSCSACTASGSDDE